MPQTAVPFDAISSPSADRRPAGAPDHPRRRAHHALDVHGQRVDHRNAEVLRALDPGFRAMAVQVDQVTGVGTIIQPGDRVDVIISFEDTDGKFPVIYEGAPTRQGTPPRSRPDLRELRRQAQQHLGQGARPGLQGPRHAAPAAASEAARAGPRRPRRPTPARSRSTASSRSSSCSSPRSRSSWSASPSWTATSRSSSGPSADRDLPPVATTGITLFELVETLGRPARPDDPPGATAARAAP